jgi:hypothetical protein
MRLKDEPGEDVNSFTTKMVTKIRRLEGAKRLPPDLGQIMATALMDCSVDTFRLQFTQVFNKTEGAPAKYTYQEIVNMATASYRTALDRKIWTPALGEQKTDEIPVSMKAELTSLIQSTVDKRVKAKGQGNNDNGGGQKQTGGKPVECWTCGGNHYARNCPKSGSKDSSIGNGGSTTKSWKKTPPKKDEPHEKKVNGKTFYWCGKCTRWTTTHGTSQHRGKKKKGETNDSTGNEQANLAQAHTDLVAGFLATMSSKDRYGQRI